MTHRFAAALLSLGLLSGLSAAAVAETPQQIRAGLMKSVGDQSKVLGGMLQGRVAFDAAQAKTAADALAKAAADFPNHFPEGSEGGRTDALPAIWQNKADFEARARKFAADASAVLVAVDQGEDAFKAAAGPMFASCKGCHELYRAPN